MRRFLTVLLIFAARVYQIGISTPIHYITKPLGAGCRFYPTCSQYFIEAVLVHGPIKGACMGLWRVCRCNPWGGCGEDLVPGWEEYVEKNQTAAYIGRRDRHGIDRGAMPGGHDHPH